MANHGVFIPEMYAAKNIDSRIRSAVTASDDVDNGCIVKLSGLSSTAGYSEVFTAVVPSTANGLTNVWIAYSPAIVDVLSGTKVYRNLDSDPRNAFNKGGVVFNVLQPAVGDVYNMTVDCFTGAPDMSTNMFLNATTSTGGYKLVPGTTQTASVFCLKLLAITYINIPTGAIGTDHVTSYRVEVVGL